MLTDFTQPRARDAARTRRQLGALAAALGTYLVVGVAAASLQRVEHTPRPSEPESVELELPPLPEPPSPSPSLAMKPALRTPPPVAPAPLAAPTTRLEAPKLVPDAPAPEAEPTDTASAEPSPPADDSPGSGSGSPNGVVGGTGTGDGGGVGAPDAAAPTPIVLPREATAPVAHETNTPPEYPALARAKGLEGEVILKLVVASTGRVLRVDVVRGESPFVEAAVSVVKQWTYEPARLGTQALTVFRIVKIPFRLAV